MPFAVKNNKTGEWASVAPPGVQLPCFPLIYRFGAAPALFDNREMAEAALDGACGLEGKDVADCSIMSDRELISAAKVIAASRRRQEPPGDV